MEKNKKKVKRVFRSIYFNDDTYDALQSAAQEEGVGFATYLKSSALNYTKTKIQHEQVLAAINSQDPAAGQKTFNEAFSELREVLNRTVVKSTERADKRMDRLERLVRRMIYVQLYYSREVPHDQKAATQLSTKTRMETLLKDIDAEPLE